MYIIIEGYEEGALNLWLKIGKREGESSGKKKNNQMLLCQLKEI